MGNKPGTKLRSSDLKYFRSLGKFTDQEIRDWYKCFHQDCPKGYLTMEEFKYIYSQYFRAGDSSTFASYVFTNFDCDNDRKISFQDFLCTLRVTAKGSFEEQLQWAFQLYDMDGDGYISRLEMLKTVQAIYKMIGSVKQFPEDESTPEKRTNKIFKKYDIDHDDRLSHDEFIQGATSDPSIVHLLQADGVLDAAVWRTRGIENTSSSMT